jgi:hypothetical protein
VNGEAVITEHVKQRGLTGVVQTEEYNLCILLVKSFCIPCGWSAFYTRFTSYMEKIKWQYMQSASRVLTIGVLKRSIVGFSATTRFQIGWHLFTNGCSRATFLPRRSMRQWLLLPKNDGHICFGAQTQPKYESDDFDVPRALNTPQNQSKTHMLELYDV